MSTTFVPTFLYIKQHIKTGKLYFGKTIKDPEKYVGSGVHWKRHIAKHGKEFVTTLWYCLFLDEDALTEFAINFSVQEHIVKSTLWANQILENGIDGGSAPGIGNGVFGKKFPNRVYTITDELRALRSKHRKEYIAKHGVKELTPEQRELKSIKMKEQFANGTRSPFGKRGAEHPMFGKHHTEEHKQQMSDRFSGENNPNYGKHTSDEVKQRWLDSGRNTGEKNGNYGKRGETHHSYGKKQSAETVEARATFNRGTKRTLVKCPFCEKLGGDNAMKRWHFANCKLNLTKVPLQSDCVPQPIVP